MKRWFVLLLICMLPMQVFAGMLADHESIESVTLKSPLSPWQMQQSDVRADAATTMATDDGQTIPEQTGSDDSGTSGTDNDDFSGHGGIGDDVVLNPALVFPADLVASAPALRSDDGSPPPFLPPAGRPPRV